jgi:hypothetical protein
VSNSVHEGSEFIIRNNPEMVQMMKPTNLAAWGGSELLARPSVTLSELLLHAAGKSSFA